MHLGKDRQEKTLCLARAGACGHDEILALGQKRLQGAPLMQIGRVEQQRFTIGPPILRLGSERVQPFALRLGKIELFEAVPGLVTGGSFDERLLG